MKEDDLESATLPPIMREIDFRSAKDHALPSFLASCASSDRLSSLFCGDLPDGLRNSALEKWKAKANIEEPTTAHTITSAWSKPLAKRLLESARGKLSTQSDVARLLAASAFESTCLFTAVPNTRDGTQLPAAAFSISVGLLLNLQWQQMERVYAAISVSHLFI